MNRNSEKQVDVFGSLESIIHSHWISDYQSQQELADNHEKLAHMLKVCHERSTKSRLIVSALNDWTRVCIHVVCLWHGYKSVTQKTKKSKNDKSQTVIIQSRSKLSNKFFPISDFLKRSLSN